MAASLPVGSIVAFAAKGVYEIPADWNLCDGSPLSRKRFPDLFRAVGTAHGAPDEFSFCVPDLRGRFLRGIAAGQGTDPDADSREEPRPELTQNGGSGGNNGDRVGSLQKHSTGKSWTPMQAEIPRLPSGTHGAQSPAGAPDNICVVHNDSMTMKDGLSGGDSESRPHNKNLYFIIRTLPASSETNAGSAPGTVLALASDEATSLASDWLPCDGRTYDATDARYSALFAEIGVSHGGDGKPEFCVPELGGMFVRGVSETSAHDPDAATRGPARPDLPAGEQGNADNAVGTSQVDATAAPNNPFETVFPHLPDDGVHCWNSLGYDTGEVNWNGLTVPIAQKGGDDESRPVNTAVDWIVQAAAEPPAPIAAVVAHGGENPEVPGWLVCNGQSVSSDAYPDLFKAIGATYGSGTGAGTFKVPDYRGYFLRGLDQSGKVDPDAAARLTPGTTLPIPPNTTPTTAGAKMGTVQNWATKRPNNPFLMHIPNLPSSCEQVFSTVWDHAVGTCGWPTIDTCTLGGDKETRPVNVGVVFLIRAK